MLMSLEFRSLMSNLRSESRGFRTMRTIRMSRDPWFLMPKVSTHQLANEARIAHFTAE